MLHQVHDNVPDALYEQLAVMSNVTIYHERAWHRLLERSMGWRVRALAVYDGATPIAWLPFVSKRRLGRRINVCLPLSHQVGIAHVGDADLDSLDLSVLWPLEMHDSTMAPGLRQAVSSFVTRIDLSDSPRSDKLLQRFHKNHIQRKIKRSRAAGLTARSGNRAEDFDTFYHLQALTRRRQGSPMYPPRFFRIMYEELRDSEAVRLHLVYSGNRAVTGVIFLHFGDTAIYAYGASVPDRDIWRLGANQLAMWSAIDEARALARKTIDLGTTPRHQTQLREYKERWAGRSHDHMHAIGGIPAAPAVVDRTSSVTELVSRSLRHMPLPLFRRLTPRIMKMVV